MLMILLALVIAPVLGDSNGNFFNVSCNHLTFEDPEVFSCKIESSSQSVYYENTTIMFRNTNNTDTIKGFIAEDMNMFYIPRGIENFIKKLSLLRVKNCGLRKVTRENLEKFDKLFHLDLSFNHIEILERDLFSANKFLQTIILNSNRIQVVEENVFNFLILLIHVEFRNNECYSGMSNDSQSTALLLEQIGTVCINYDEKFDNLTNDNAAMQKQIRDLTSNFSQHLSNFTAIKAEDLARVVKNEIEILLILAILIFFGVFVLIILIIILICKSLNHQTVESTMNKDKPCDTVTNFTKPNDNIVGSIDLSKENEENLYQELPYDEIRSLNNSQNNVNVRETYSEVINKIEPINEDRIANLYAVVNKN
ncbi:hypothetical protein ACKWTF_014177 [Chironomus riparius]